MFEWFYQPFVEQFTKYKDINVEIALSDEKDETLQKTCIENIKQIGETLEKIGSEINSINNLRRVEGYERIFALERRLIDCEINYDIYTKMHEEAVKKALNAPLWKRISLTYLMLVQKKGEEIEHLKSMINLLRKG